MAKRRAKNRKRVLKQGELFASVGLFPVRRPDERSADLSVRSLRMRAAMTQAVKQCGDSREVVAARIAEITDRPFTPTALDTYTAGSKPEHDIGLMRFVAFVRATGATWLWQELLADEGITIMVGEEAKLAERGLLEQERRRLDKQIKALDRELTASPVTVKRRSPSARDELRRDRGR